MNNQDITDDKATNLWLEAARQLDVKTLIIDAEHGYAKLYDADKTLYVQSNLLSINDNVAVSNSRSLFLSLKLLESGGCPIPPYLHLFSNKGFKEPENIESIFDFTENGYPVIFGSDKKSRRVPVIVNNDDELAMTLLELRNSSMRRLFVTHPPLKPLYKILVFREKVIRINKIETACLQGDNQNAIDKLLSKFNSNAVDEYGFKISKKDFQQKYLDNTHFSMSSVLSSSQNIQLDKELINGYGAPLPVDCAEIPKNLERLIIKAANASRLELVELDYCSSDIDSSEPDGYFYSFSSFPTIFNSNNGSENHNSLGLHKLILQQFFDIQVI